MRNAVFFPSFCGPPEEGTLCFPLEVCLDGWMYVSRQQLTQKGEPRPEGKVRFR